MNPYSLNEQLTALYRRFTELKHKPVVGISANYDEQTARLAEAYYKQVEAAGGTPLILPPLADAAVLNSTLDRIDALLLSGGADLNPLFMGEEPLPQLGSVNAERDLPELLITRLAFNRQMPILGICRGIQTLAVALGGKVAQDIATAAAATSEEKPSVKHSQQAGRAVATHSIHIKEGSTLATLYPSQTIYVNSFHHQAVTDTGLHLNAVATAPDGTIEAVESNELKPIMGVQWHPECMTGEGLPLFQWLVGQAASYRQAQQLHDRVLTLDTHCDTPMFFPQGIDFTTRDDRILVDLPKMQEGRLDATIMVAYIPQNSTATPQADNAFDYANNIFNQIESIAAKSHGRIALARTPDQLWANKQAGRKSIMLGIENGKALMGNLAHVEHFARRGVVYITLCHNGDNLLCDSARGEHTHNGLSNFGQQVVAEMNRLGIMVDLSHASEKSFYDALDCSLTPIVCSHSSARALCDHPRNLTDEQMRRLAAAGGVCQITLYPGFLRQDDKATILDAMNHLEHAIKVMGVEHVGLGTDFDGDGGVRGLASAAELTLFTRQLLRRQYSEADIQLIWGGNFLRVMRQVQALKKA